MRLPLARRSAVGSSPASIERRVVMLVFAASTLVFLFLQEGAITGSDGASMFAVTDSIVSDRDLGVEPGLGVPGRGGESYSKYGPGQSLISLVPYVGSLPLAEALGDRRDTVLRFAVSSLIPVLSGLLIASLYALGRRLGAGRRAAVAVALGIGFGTYFLPYAKEFFSEPLAALTTTLAIERTLAKRWGWAGLALGMAILTRPQTIAFLPVIAFIWWRGGGREALARAGAPVAAAGALLAAYNVARFGDLTSFGYDAEPGFSTSIWRGTAGLLFDPAASILLFAPVIVLMPLALRHVWRARPEAGALLAGNAIITFAITATWHSWAGGWSWGPRLLLPGVVPLLMVLAPWVEQHARRARAAFALFLLGFVASFPALLVSTRAQQLEASPNETGPLVIRQYALIGPVTDHTLDNVRARGDGDHREFLSLWQINVAGELGAAGWLLAGVGSVTLVAGAAIVTKRLTEALRSVERSDTKGTSQTAR